jgi:hypothetical protein
LTLRQQEKIFAHTRIVLNSFEYNEYVFPSLLIILIYIRAFHEKFYTNIKGKRLSLEDLLEEFSKIIPSQIDEDTAYFIHLEANLVYMYNNSIPYTSRKKLFQKNDAGEETPIINSKIDKPDGFHFSDRLKSFTTDWKLNDPLIEYLTNKIDLIEKITL